jgi:hypothetical protein
MFKFWSIFLVYILIMAMKVNLKTCGGIVWSNIFIMIAMDNFFFLFQLT